MGAGRVRVSNYLIGDALQFPESWEIKSINPCHDDIFDCSEMLIYGPDFPSVNSQGDAERIELVYHKQIPVRIDIKRCK